MHYVTQVRRGDLQQKPSTYRATRTSLLLVKNSAQEYSSSTGCLKFFPVKGGVPQMKRDLLSKRYQRPYVSLFLHNMLDVVK